jgi:hypothetical protein
MRWSGHVARMGLIINEYKIHIGKPEWKRDHAIIGMDLRKIVW